MNKAYRLSEAISFAGEDFLTEVLEYRDHSMGFPTVLKLGTGLVAAAAVILMVILRMDISKPITVYAYGTDQKLESMETVMLAGSIGDDGSMQGMPLRFYVTGDGIQEICFSCKNQWLTGTDWTEKRESHGLCKSFTMEYGEETKEYSYIVIEWVPNELIRKLTDHADIGIQSLTEEERKDVIVMEVRLLNGEKKTMAINVTLQEDGHFAAWVSDYEITAEGMSPAFSDASLYQEKRYTNSFLEESATDGSGNTDGTAAGKESGETEFDALNTNTELIQNEISLTEGELDLVHAAIDSYYKKTSHKVVGYVLLHHYASIVRSYDGYEDGEVLYFEVTEKGSEVKRYIAVGSKDHWMNCEILNEGY